MIPRFIYTLMTVAWVSACATPEPPKHEFHPGTRVGIINHLENKSLNGTGLAITQLPRGLISRLGVNKI